MTEDKNITLLAGDPERTDAALFAAYAPLGVARWCLVADEAGDTVQIRWFEEFWRMAGYDEANMPRTAQAIRDRMHPNERDRVQEGIRRAVLDPSGKTELDVEFRLQHTDGTWHWYRSRGGFDADDAGPGHPFYGLTVNIDAEKRVDEALAEEARKLAAAGDRQRQAIEETSRLRRRQQATIRSLEALNASLEQGRQELDQQMLVINGLSRDCNTVWHVKWPELTGKLYRNLAPASQQAVIGSVQQTNHFPTGFRLYVDTSVLPEDRPILLPYCDGAAVKAALRRERFLRLRHRRVTDGRIEYYEAVFVRPETGEDFVLALRNVDDIVRREQQKKAALATAADAAARADRAKSVFLNSISHDIRTPLHGILGMADIARRHANDPRRVADCLAKITGASHHLMALVNEVLDVSRIESGRISLAQDVFSLTEAFATAASLMAPQAKAAGLRLSAAVRSVAHEAVMGDALRLRQVFVNFLSNAVKFTPSGGDIDVTLEERPCASRHYSEYVFTCRDTGCGMSEDFLARIFDPFERSSDAQTRGIPGTGLGMSITKNIIETMDGDIKVTSAPGRGSVFSAAFRLKRAQKALASDPALKGIPVLLAGRDNEASRSLQAFLQDAGMDAMIADTPDEACRLLSRQENPFRLVIVDDENTPGAFLSPGRLLAAAGRPMPLVRLEGGDLAAAEEQRSLEAGFTTCLTRPLYRSKIEALVKSLLTEGARSLEPRSQLKAFGETDFSGRRVLLVEDNELNREIELEILRLTRVATDVARDGQEAVERFNASPQWTYDLILMDIQMPEMDGLAASRAIRACARPDAATVPIVALTANAFSEDRATALASGMNDYLAKPVNLAALLDVMKRHLAK